MQDMINVTKTYLPPLDEFVSLLQRAWQKGWITNNGELLRELEEKLRKYLEVPHLYVCTNGTVVLQMAIKALELSDEIITTPFSYVATTNAILWEKCTPIFADVNPADLTIDTTKIESLVSEKTSAILATHVYGNPCDVEAIESIAKKHNLKVIYDAAHAFGVRYKGKSIFSYGDISTCSFHATKIFHMGEGGAVATTSESLARKLYLFRQFGHVDDDYFGEGINAKNSELHAALGLAVLPSVNWQLEKRKMIHQQYVARLCRWKLLMPVSREGTEWNFCYFPVVFETEDYAIRVKEKLTAEQIFPRRYFYPSLNELPFLKSWQSCPVSESFSRRVLCLPQYAALEENIVDKICQIVNKVL
jgi:dTDP-4-amino-4,6-dideoxygalactose transaminase